MLEGIIQFLKKTGKLKRVKRSGWISQVGIENPESVADHSFRSAVLAMCIADLEGLNAEKLVRMLLLHDVHEAVIGDYDYFAKKKISSSELEKRKREAIKNILSTLPEDLRRKYLSIWLEFEEQKTEESKLARQIDKLEMAIQALEYEKEGYSREKLSVFWKSVKNELEASKLKEILEFLEREKASSNQDC